MKSTVFSRLASLVLALGLLFPLGAMPVGAQEACWDNSAIQAALAEGRIQPVAAVLSREGIDPSTERAGFKSSEQAGSPAYVGGTFPGAGT